MADPKERHAGWTAYVYYGGDQATARDARRFGLEAAAVIYSPATSNTSGTSG